MAKKIWIDLDNSPHVPLFKPIIEELRGRGYSVLVTARDAFQVCDLADAAGLSYQRIGRHFGKHKLLKIAGLGVRALQLAPVIAKERPDIAVSHGSRAQIVACTLARVPSVLLMDYEFARGLVLARPDWVMVAEPIEASAIPIKRERLLKYPGIKEDVYVPQFKPDASIRKYFGLDDTDLLVTLRPPANEAHYHNPESDKLFSAVLEMLSREPQVKTVLLPRNHAQEMAIRKSWPHLFASRKLIVPEHAVDGLNLIWHSELVISGGGTMNREAAALRVPVYSIFRGKIGGVDRFLEATGRLVLLQSVEDVKTKIALKRRNVESMEEIGSNGALEAIVNNIIAIAEGHDATAVQHSPVGIGGVPVER